MNESIPNDIRQGRPLNRDIIKYIAMFTMTLNHLSLTGFIGNYELAKQFTYIGYFTLITMTYFLVEGFAYTRDRMKYGRRLLLFAVLSEAPFLYALKIAPGESFSSDQVELNVIFNLFFCFLILTALESAQTAGMKILEIAVLFIGSAMSDWSVMAPAFTLIFYFSAHGWKKPCPHMNGIPYGTARARREKIGYLLCLLFFIICTSAMSAVYLLSLRGNGIFWSSVFFTTGNGCVTEKLSRSGSSISTIRRTLPSSHSSCTSGKGQRVFIPAVLLFAHRLMQRFSHRAPACKKLCKVLLHGIRQTSLKEIDAENPAVVKQRVNL